MRLSENIKGLDIIFTRKEFVEGYYGVEMACNSCSTKFTFMKKEHGCKNCGFSFCKDCLQKKIEVPKHNNEKHKVCNKCYNVLTGKIKPQKNPAKYSPPEALRKMQESRENKSKHKATGHAAPKPTNPPLKSYAGMSKEDIAIAQRLEKLKEKPKDAPVVPSQKEMEERLQKLKEDSNTPAAPSQTEMEDRLSKLKGQDPTSANKPHVFHKETRPQAQQVDDLLDEICAEVDIDSHGIDYAADVEARLRHFRGEPEPPPTTKDKPINPEDYLQPPNKPSSQDQSSSQPKTQQQGTSGSKWREGYDADLKAAHDVFNEEGAKWDEEANKAVTDMYKDKEMADLMEEYKKKAEKEKGKPIKDEDENGKEEKSETSDTEKEDDKASEELIRKILAEDALDEASGYSESSSKKPDPKKPTSKKTDEEDVDPDELPYCCICTNDATLRCHTCDRDLFCKRCFKEAHDLEDATDHIVIQYTPPKQT